MSGVKCKKFHSRQTKQWTKNKLTEGSQNKENRSQTMLDSGNQTSTTEAANAAMMAVKAENSVNIARSVQAMPKMCRPLLKQPKFDWKPEYKYEVQ